MASKYGKWQVVDSLDQGGQAHLYRVTDSTEDDFIRRKNAETNDVFVLKRLKNTSRKEVFEQEIKAILTLKHPNILRLVDWDMEGNKPYYVAEYCQSGSLEKIGAQRFKGDIGAAIEVIMPVVEALNAAHTAGIIHRDIKPSNILVRHDGSPVVADFGICHMLNDERLTLTDEAKGSVNYIPPEMESGGPLRFGPVKPEADGYSIGKVIYWLLSGGSIFARERHRDRPLTLLLGHQRFEHVHRFLDEILVENPGNRIKFSSLPERLQQLRYLVDGGFSPLRPSIQLRCRFCGLGTYEKIARFVPSGRGGNPLQRLGLTNFSAMNFGALRCSHCGHIETFDFHQITAVDWWEK